MKFRAPLFGPGKRSNRNRHGRRMFLEPLEPRHLMIGSVDEPPGTPFEQFDDNYLPKNYYQVGTQGGLTATSTAAPLDIALNYLRNNAASFGLSQTDLAHYSVSHQHTSSASQVTHIYLQQTFNGLPVVDAVANVSISQYGQVLSAGISFVPGLPHPAVETTITPAWNAESALYNVAYGLGDSLASPVEVEQVVGGRSQKVIFGENDISLDPITAELHYVPVEGGGVDLAWKYVVRAENGKHWYEVSIGAGAMSRQGLTLRLTDYIDHASYNVFPRPVRDPLDGGRTIVIDPQDATASQFGWHDVDGVAGADTQDTSGNNVFVQDDLDANDTGGLRPNGGATQDFNNPFILGNMAGSINAGMDNVFYWVNLSHDVTYHYGFDEASGNFQLVNYSGQGVGGDQVQADVHDPTAIFNAYMATLPEGQSPRMAMGLFPIFNTSTAFDGAVVAHEYFHGVSNRLTGGPFNVNALNALQSGGMGEGWSDWFALMLVVDSADNKNTPQAIGNWILGQPSTGPGVRRQPYSFDFAIDPLTLDDYNGDTFPQQNNSEVHNAGEIWASALWDMTWLLIEKYGFDQNIFTGSGGNNIAMSLVMEGLKLQPANPTFIQARDAILAADEALFGGINTDEIWEAFARRGFGLSASAGTDADSLTVVAAFDAPPRQGRVSGTVINDVNGNGERNSGEPGLAGWTIYVDANNNQQFDSGERNAVSNAQGRYRLAVPSNTTQRIREVVQADWRKIEPPGAHVVNLSPGESVTRNFYNQEIPGEIHGLKFNDLNGDGEWFDGEAFTDIDNDGIRDPNEPFVDEDIDGVMNGVYDPPEPGIEGVVVYVDVNLDGKIGALEWAAVTDYFGRYQIKNVRPGTWRVREVLAPGTIQTYPDPLDAATFGGAHVGVTVTRNTIITGMHFGNQFAVDWGDAPAPYATLAAATPALSGPSHGIIAGFGLTLTPGTATGVVDAETNGQPGTGNAFTPPLGNALGDDSAGVDDENGVQIPFGVQPGTTVTFPIGVRTGGAPIGMLQAWIDFDRDGVFEESERVIRNRSLATGVHTNIPVTIPPTALAGRTFARFRYGYEQDLAPTGPALAGEVEDYAIDIRDDMVQAVDDVIPGAGPAINQNVIKRNSVDNPINVLWNDIGSINDPTPIIGSIIFPSPLRPGEQIQLVDNATTTGANILYTPPTGAVGTVSFRYTIQTNDVGAPFSTDTGEVFVTIAPADPIATDDFLALVAPAAGTATGTIDVLANDIPFAPSTTGNVKPFISAVTPLNGAPAGLVSVTSGGGSLTYNIGAANTGTFQYRYTLTDNEGSTNDDTAIVTLQVSPTNVNTPAASHEARFRVEYRSTTTANPISNVMLGDQFDVYIFVQDLPNTTGLDATVTGGTNGVEQAFLDLIVQEVSRVGTPTSVPTSLVQPVAIGGTLLQLNAANFFNTPGVARLGGPQTFPPNVISGIGAPRAQAALPFGNTDTLLGFVRFQANNTIEGSIRIQPDHAEPAPTDPPNSNFTQIAVNDRDSSPLAIADNQVFMQLSPVLTVSTNATAEGEFTNASNQYDVNADEVVNIDDLVDLIGDIVENGSRDLNQFALALSAAPLPNGFMDVNIDSHVNMLDIVDFISYITSSQASLVAGGAGDGEGEGEGPSPAALESSAPAASTETDPALQMLAATTVAEDSSPSVDSAEEAPAQQPAASDALSPESMDAAPAASSSDETLDAGRTSGPVDAQAADELFASLSPVQTSLRSRLSRKR